MEDGDGPSMQVFQEAMSHLIVRETKRQCRILGILDEHNTKVVAQLDSSFRSATLEQNENWSKMEKTNGAIWREDLVS